MLKQGHQDKYTEYVCGIIKELRLDIPICVVVYVIGRGLLISTCKKVGFHGTPIVEKVVKEDIFLDNDRDSLKELLSNISTELNELEDRMIKNYRRK